MMHSLSTSATGMLAQQLNIDIIANNLANVNTTAFKRSRAEFQDLMYQTERPPGSPQAAGLIHPTSIQIGLGVQTAAIAKNFTQGDFKQTGNPLDLVIQGDGFFQVTLPDGTQAYTRDGAFKLDNQGRIVTNDGFPVFPDIVIPPNTASISVGADGTVSVLASGSTTAQTVGQIQLASFINPAGLNSKGQNLYLPTEASGDPIVGVPGENNLGLLNQGFLEQSNVRVVEEMVNLVVAQRAFEANSKAVQASDDILNQAVNLRR